MAKMNVCLEMPLVFDIKVEQSAHGKFRVTYGKQVRRDLDYVEAAHELGECIFHALACEGKVR